MIDQNTFTDQFAEMTKNSIKARLNLKDADMEQIQDLIFKISAGLIQDPENNKTVFLHLLANLETAIMLCHRYDFPKEKLMEEVNLFWDKAEKTQLSMKQELRMIFGKEKNEN